jgi:hypothetical protein
LKRHNFLTSLFLAPEQQDVYSLQNYTARALQWSAMDANDGEHFAPSGATVFVGFQGYKHHAPSEQRQVRQDHAQVAPERVFGYAFAFCWLPFSGQ